MPDKLTFGSRLVGNRLIVYDNRVEIIRGPHSHSAQSPASRRPGWPTV